MFRLTENTRGGLLLILIFFYLAFVLGMAIFIETNSNDKNNTDDNAICITANACTFTLMRLTFFDG